jgi:hypothetical protein
MEERNCWLLRQAKLFKRNSRKNNKIQTFKGNRMKHKKLSSLLAVTLSLELMVSPLIPAVQAQTTNPPATTPTTTGTQNRDSFGSAMNNVSQGLQAIGGIWQTVNQARNGSQGAMTAQMAGDMAKMKDQQTPQTDKYFNAQKLMQMPGLGEYLALNNINPGMLDCKTLPTTLHDAKPEVCRIGVTNDRGVAQPAQLQQMFTYYNQYFQTSKMYKNFSADSNSDGQAFGVGCMNNAMNILNGFFKYRLNELDKLTTNLEAMQAQFEAASRSDLDAIEEAVAVLDGDSEIADKVRSKKPDLFDFSKRFADPACKSMFAGSILDDQGRAGGLNAINKSVRDSMNDTKGGKYSGASYSQSHAAVVEDIKSVADKMAKQFQLNFTPNLAGGDYSALLKNISGSVSSTTGVTDGIKLDLLSDTQTKFLEQSTKLATERSTVLSELKGAEKAMSLMGNLNSSASFEAEVASLENGMKNECLAGSLGDADSLMSKIYDPTASKHANKNASNFLKDKLKQILANEKTSPEKKLAELKSLESSEGNRFYMRMENSYEVQEVDANGNIKTTVIPASQNRSPSVFFSDVIKNCNAQFKANKLNNKLSGAQAIQKLRDLNNSYKTLAQTQAADMKKELTKKLIECSSPEVANNTVPGSCQSGLFNPSAPGFCANAALSCSKNMQACSAKAEGFVKEIRDQKTARVNNYKALVDKNKKDIVKIFDTALAKYMKDGELMRGMFGAGFSSPAGIKREVPEGQRYLSEFASATGKQGSPDGKLLLEDPAKYTEMFKQNIDLLKKSVQAQQDQILGGDSVGTGKNPGLLADHIKKTQKNYQDVIKEADKIAGDCLNQHDNAIKAAEAQRAQQQADYQKKMTELGEKRDKFCNMYGMARTNPQAVCGGVTEELITASSQAASIAGPNQAAARNNVSQLAAVCRQYGNSSSSSGSINAETLCADVNRTNQRFVTDASMKTQIQTLCTERNTQRSECNRATPAAAAPTTPPTTPANPTTVVTRDCAAITTDFNDRIVAQYNLGPDLAGGDVTLEDAPAYCTAGDNSSRESSMGGWGKTFSDSLARAMGQAASGQ